MATRKFQVVVAMVMMGWIEAQDPTSCCCVSCSGRGCNASMVPCPDCIIPAQCSTKVPPMPGRRCYEGHVIEKPPFSYCHARQLDQSSTAKPHVIFSTGNATSAATGLDVDQVQSVAVRFSVSAIVKPFKLDLWLMANGPNATISGRIVKGQADAPNSSSTTVATIAPFGVLASDWTPEMQSVLFESGSTDLQAGTGYYWLLLESADLAGHNGVWLLGEQTAWSTTNFGGSWQRIDQSSAAPGLSLWAV